MSNKNFIKENVSESKGIPNGRDFSKAVNIYKVIDGYHADSFADVYHRKKSDGWGGNADCYGIVGYTHMLIKGAMHLVGSYGGTIIQMKLLGGFERYVFFDADRDPDIKKALINTYGSELSVEEQIYAITGDRKTAQDFAFTSSGRFGTKLDRRNGKFWIPGDAEKIMRRTGQIIRGFVCEYQPGDAMVAPFVFSDMVTCAVAHNVKRGDSEEAVKSKFQPTLDARRRAIQDDYIDLVPHLYAVDAMDTDSEEGARIGDKLYISYTSRSGEHNMLIIDERNWGNPQDKKIFPSDVKLDREISNPSIKGTFIFSMNGQQYVANVCGTMTNGEEIADFPIFAIRGCESDGSWWFPMEHKTLSWVYQNPDWTMAKKEEYYENNQLRNVSESVDYKQALLKEAFKPGMSYNEFVDKNQGVGYVCAHCYSIESLMQQGFTRWYAAKNDANYNNGRGWYGNGVYGCVQIGAIAPPDQFKGNLSMKDAGAARLSFYWDSDTAEVPKPDNLKYGGVILKCAIIGGYHRFLMLDKEWAQRYYGNNWTIEDQVRTLIGPNNPDAQALIAKLNSGRNVRYEVTANDSRTGGALLDVFKFVTKEEFEHWEAVFRKYNIRGAVYHGGNDGFCFVCYDYSEVVPIALSYDNGRTWTTKGNSWTLKNGKTYTTNGINWQAVHDRLMSGGDPRNKLGALYSDVDIEPQEVRFCSGEIAGLVSVRGKNGKYNFVTMQEIHGNDGNILYNKYDKIFPVDFDEKASISLKGGISFIYKGINFRGKVYDEEANAPVIIIRRNTINGPVEERFTFEYIDWFAENYEAYVRGDFDENNATESGNEEEYQVQDDSISNQELQESFFRFLDKMEFYYD